MFLVNAQDKRVVDQSVGGPTRSDMSVLCLSCVLFGSVVVFFASRKQLFVDCGLLDARRMPTSSAVCTRTISEPFPVRLYCLE